VIRRQVALGLMATVAGIGLAATALHARDRQKLPEAATTRLLYLRSTAAAKRVFLSFNALAADVYWIRTIQHYGRDRKKVTGTPGKFELLQPLLDLTTTLDPRFNVAYRFGAIFLSADPPDGPGASDQAIALLQKGLHANPQRWQYAYDIGFVHYWHTGHYEEAAHWFERAADMPFAPEWIRPLAATTLAQGGDRAGARTMLVELLRSPEPYIQRAAERSLAQLQALDAIDTAQAFVERARDTLGRYPDDWAEIVRALFLPGIPADPTGTPFLYDARTHVVSLDPQSPLSPLPPRFARR
jgi:tetratricopeptide (TPR) repeat protein